MATISGGTKLQRELEKMAEKLTQGGATLRVGFLEGATYPNGTSVGLVAAVNEFGRPAKGQPPRPFFRNMVKKRSPGWAPAIAVNLKATNYDVHETLRRVGEGIKGQLQQAIVEFEGAPLAQSTIDRKGFDKQLIDTSHMLNSVDYEVK